DTYLLGELTFFSSVFLMVPSASRTTFSSDFFTVPSSFTSTFFSSLTVSSQPVRTGIPIERAMNMASRFLNFMSWLLGKCRLCGRDEQTAGQGERHVPRGYLASAAMKRKISAPIIFAGGKGTTQMTI